MLEEANTQYAAGKLTLAAVTDRQAGKIAPVVTELLDYATMAVGSVAAFMNPEIIVLAGRVVGGGPDRPSGAGASASTWRRRTD